MKKLTVADLIRELELVVDKTAEVQAFVKSENYRGRFTIQEVHKGAVGSGDVNICAIELKGMVSIIKMPV